MHKHVLRCCVFTWAAMAGVASAATITVNTSDDPIGANLCPAVCSLRHAITAASVLGGDTIVFAPGLASPIALTQGEVPIDRPLTIQGPGAQTLTISAQNASRVFVVYAPATISDLEIADGAAVGANGADATTEAGAGGPGASIAGGCVAIPAAVAAVFDRVAIRHCQANGGEGGKGAASLHAPTGGGNGGAGGNAGGGAIELYGSLSLLDSSIVDAQARGGTGGKGGDGSSTILGGKGGKGGDASGGAIYAHDGSSLRIANSTIAQSASVGGTGGARGLWGLDGDGGNATGGLLLIESGVVPADLEFSTLANGSVVFGVNGGISPSRDGTASANAINAGANLTALSSIVVGAQSGVTLCKNTVTSASGSVNLAEDTSCGFSAQATFAQTLVPLDVTTTPWPAYAPVAGGPAVDAAATCLDIAAQTVTADQHGTARPQGPKCDLGAIEFQPDKIFADGFDG